MKAPEFKAWTEKTTFDRVKDKSADLSHKTVDKAVELKDQAALLMIQFGHNVLSRARRQEMERCLQHR